MAGSVIGALRASMTLETAAFDKGIDRSKTKLRQFDADTRKMASGVSGLGRELGAGLGPVGTVLDKIGAAGLVAGVGVGAAVVAFQGMQSALKFADDLDATATKIGITAEQFQELTFAAKENDITTEALSQSLQGLNVSLGAYKAGVGDAKVKKIFEALGITRESLANVNNAADFLPILADKIKGLQSTAERVKIAKALGVEDMVPLLEKGGAEIDRLAAKARDLGLVMSNDLTAKAADANRELEVMGDYISAHLSIAFAGLSTWLMDAAKDFQPLIDKIKEATEAMRKYQERRGKEIATTLRTRAADMERANGGKPTRQSALLRTDAEHYDPTQFGDSAIGDRMATGAAFAALRPSTSAGGGGGGAVTSRRRPSGSVPATTSFADKKVEVITFDPEIQDILDQLAYWRKVEERGNQPLTADPNPNGFQTSADRMNEATAAIEATRAQNQEAFRSMFAGGLMAALHDGKDGVKEWMRQGAERGLDEALNNLADLLSKLFSDAGSGMSSGGTSGITSTIGNIISSIFGGARAGGGSVNSGRAYLVGEKGPELFVPPTSGRITSNGALARVGGASGGVTQNFDLRGAVVTEQLYAQMRATAAQAAGVAYQAARRDIPAAMAKQQRYQVAR